VRFDLVDRSACWLTVLPDGAAVTAAATLTSALPVVVGTWLAALEGAAGRRRPSSVSGDDEAARGRFVAA